MKKSRKTTSLLVAILSIVVIVLVFILSYFTKANKGTPLPTQATQLSQEHLLPTTQEMQGSTQTQTQTQQKDPNLVTQEAGSIPANGRVKFKTGRFKKLALQPLEFEVFDEQGKALRPENLKTVQLHKMHFIVVSANLKEYLHLFPDFKNGKWQTFANLPNPGTYYAYVDIAPVKGNPVVLRSELIVQKLTSGEITYPGPTPDRTVSTSNNFYSARLTLTKPSIYQQTILSYKVKSNVTGTPVIALDQLGGTFGHVVIMREGDPSNFMHTNALSSSDASKGLAEFVATFAKSGRYIAFAQFKLKTKIYTFPIVFEIT